MKLKIENSLVFIFFLIISVNSQVIQDGECDPGIPVVDNFNANTFAGKWYEIHRTQNQLQTGDCSYFEFEKIVGSNWTEFDVHNRIINNNFLKEYQGVGSLVDPAKFVISLDNFGQDIDFWILMSVDRVFALGYSCETFYPETDNSTELSPKRKINLWKLSRQPFYANENLINNGMDIHIYNLFGIEAIDVMYNVSHTDVACHVLPELEDGEDIVIPGQCEDIPVLHNIDYEAFSGLWHNIGSYDYDKEQGNCLNTHFTFKSVDDINVLSTRVIDELLYTKTSTVTVGEDGAFIFTKDTDEGPKKQKVYLIDTDYKSYAISYNCEDVGDNQRRLYSQILTRSRQISEETMENIKQVFDSFVELNSQYYNYIDQSDTSCFYFPEHVENQPVIFRGQCDLNMKNMDNLNMKNLEGIWHVIEGYPNKNLAGTCVNFEFKVDDLNLEVLHFQNTQVLEERLYEISGYNILDNDVFTMDVNNGSSVLRSWVLGTNYNSYALIYSCVNINEDERAVWSWKLSREKQMSSQGNNEIDRIIDTINVLDKRYYQTEDQSEKGCFFYPLPIEGKPVVFPGQCDQNIAVVENFDITKFQGAWNEIAAYPKTQQQGKCINFEFVVHDNNLIFSTSEVNDQFLETGSGTLKSLDGSAKFLANINFNGEEYTDIPYSILTTNYEDYALAYSCININKDFRAIWSWKLSRTRSLSTIANSAINEVISDVVVLGEEYYEDTEHTDEACFYLPVLEPGEPVIIRGSCDPNIAVVDNFDEDAYSGLWHMISSYTDDFQEGTCNDVTYKTNEDGEIEIFNTQVLKNQSLAYVTGSVARISADGSAKFRVSYDDGRKDREYWILDTDYKTYSLVYSCENVNDDHRRVWSWKLSRTRSLSEEADTSINKVINTVNVLNNRYYQDIDNSDDACFYFPEPVENQPVEFRGQCDLNLPTVANFQKEKFTGLWHDIESYPSVFHKGTCSNVFYDLVSDRDINILSTQVINKSLDDLNLKAEFAEDGSAKYQISRTIPGSNEEETITYWILDTDYDGYALLYSCKNINENHRAVWSYKLSRTKELTPAANLAINNVINGINTLESQYYEIRDQSREGCFYYPEAVPGKPVILPGQCENNINYIADVDIEKFLGKWHQISAYPTTQLTGTCLYYDYISLAESAFNILTSQIIDQQIVTFSGKATEELDGKFTVNINIDGQEINVPYWILTTDYNSYALAYSCININDDFRAVWSWILSREKTLSNEAKVDIDEAISSVAMLDSRYYEENDQSDEACFYLPEIDDNEPVIFFGQCDATIPVVQNFDPEKYAGLWHEIESYFEELQDGECQDTTYNLTDSNNYEVIGSQVISTILDTISGTAILSPDGTAKFEITKTRDSTNEKITSTYWILSTDYDSYSLVYSCENLSSERRRVTSWKLSRDRYLSPDAETEINRIIETIPVLNKQYYRVVDHSNSACFYYPEVTGRPVIFRGQCSNDISVVQNFDINRYLGDWYDVESYPQFFQQGNCPKASYSLNNDNNVEVRNTEVIEQELIVVSGEARINSDDGSAKLLVTFPTPAGNDIESPYWVLSTDYDSYAFVYSCTNLSPDRRAVSAWKLSREPNLSPESAVKIDSIIDEIDVLHQDYFIQRKNSEDDCFFYPDNNGGPVYLEGQCSESVNDNYANGFDANSFSGEWYELSRFPSELQTGLCASVEFSRGLNNVETTIVNDERILKVSGSVTFNAEEGNFVMRFSGQDDIVVYVLETDYSDFALTYSCENYNSTHKQVYSWKLGRNQDGISGQSNERINEIVRDHVDLFHGYYEETAQDPYACFHYPQFDNPSTIELPGKCNETIRGIANFNKENFQGRWYEISRYPSDQQNGECARFECNVISGEIHVRATSVKDEILSDVLGVATVSSDGSGLLQISFEEANEVMDYYILDTDYSNYALVYNCINLSNGNRKVSSWKLSRYRTLDEEYEKILAPIIKETQGLLEDYYIDADQSDNSCFYIPDDNSASVIFRGECDKNVRGVENFNVQNYLGWWHEIESYRSDGRDGNCVSLRYEQNGGQIGFTYTEVLQGTAKIATGTVVANEHGKLRKTFSNGDVVDMWVLATDYNSYSLLYTCEDLDHGYRRVWSAKQSITRGLTQEARDAMKPTIDANRVLLEQFYLPISQTDENCFYYPELNGPFVVLPGQCDRNIPVLNNFDLDAYSNIWYLIEDYPHPDQKGQCSGVIYNPRGEPGNFRVRNFQLIGDELEIEEGIGMVTSNDGSARMLIVREPSESNNEPTGTEVFVLASDYESYSLVYTCRNIDEFHRYVGAWKLSRTRSLTPAAVTAINNVIAQRQELHQPYFSRVRQDDDCPSSSQIIYSSSVLILVLLSTLFL